MSANQLLKDLHRAHQYLYYVKNRPILSDKDFDSLEAHTYFHEDAPVGSDKEQDYPLSIKALAIYLSTRRYELEKQGGQLELGLQ